MKKKMLGFIVLLIVLTTVFTFSASAQNKQYSFSVAVNGYAFSAANPKDDNEQRAYIYTQSGTLSPSRFVYFSSYSQPINNSQYNYTGSLSCSSNNARILLDYFYTTVKGQNMYLKVESDTTHSNSVAGYWYS